MTAKRAMPKIGVIELTWQEPEIEGYSDLLPIERIGTEGTLVHDVRSPNGGITQAKCFVKPGPKRADLDYSNFVAFNQKRDMEIGVMRLLFSDIDRTQVVQMLWKDHGSAQFYPAKYDFRLTPPPVVAPYTGLKGEKAPKIQRLVLERIGQVRFRKELKSVYGNQCCISGCTVAEALDGAHIDPYVGSGSNRPQNGLLLRRDLHALFDAGLLAVHPSSHVV